MKNIENQQAILNAEYSWQFEVKARPEAEIKLFKDNKEIKLGDRVVVNKTTEFGQVIIFKQVVSSDIGKYKLVAVNKCGSASSEASLTVAGAPYFTKKPDSQVSFPEKKVAKVEFEVSGIPMPEVLW